MDDFSQPVRDDFDDWRASTEREWDTWDRSRILDEKRERGDDECPEADSDAS